MDRDEDILAALPAPPPPAPQRREAAIAAALARFDGTGSSAARQPRAKEANWWSRLQQPKMGALVAAVLIVAISLPIALRMAPQPVDATGEPMASSRPDTPSPAAARPVDTASALPHTAASPPAGQASAARKGAAAPAPNRDPTVAKPSAAPPPRPAAYMPPPPPPRALAQVEARNAADSAIVVSARRRESAAADTPVAVAAAPTDYARDNAGEIIVTSAARAAPKRGARGDWNACTVNDPSQSLSRCTRLATTGNRKSRERAQAHLADGLQKAWQGDADAAVAAFDKAIAAAPQLGAAYLNRGLAYERKGDFDRALADLDQAVRYAPAEARGFYLRSLILRKLGDDDRARADERRAVELDRRYEAVVP